MPSTLVKVIKKKPVLIDLDKSRKKPGFVITRTAARLFKDYYHKLFKTVDFEFQKTYKKPNDLCKANVLPFIEEFVNNLLPGLF